MFVVHDQGRVRKKLDDVIQALLDTQKGVLGQGAVGDVPDQGQEQIFLDLGEAGFIVLGPTARVKGVLGLEE